LQLNFLPPFRWRQTETLAFFWTIRKSDYFAAFWKGFRIVGKIEREDDGKGDLAFGQFNGLIVQSNLFGEVVGQGQEAEGSVGLLDVAKHLQERFLQRSIVLKKVGLKRAFPGAVQNQSSNKDNILTAFNSLLDFKCQISLKAATR
jgi:hypothetical protein